MKRVVMTRTGEDAVRPWHGFALSGPMLETEMRVFAAAHPSVFLFELNGRDLICHGKDPAKGPVAPNPWHRNALDHRASTYLSFFRQVIALFGIRGRALFPVNLDDLFDPNPALPVFMFQRPHGSRAILLPDIELIDEKFYIGDHLQDHVPLADKSQRAVFVGSNTGEDAAPWDDEAEIKNARMKAALMFRGVPEVDFFLPSVVQDDPALHEAMKRIGIFGRRMSWSEQFNYRFLLSMDGHGAACSRLEIALRSNAIPIKFNSHHELYFFPEMKPWQHYLPASGPDDILPLMGLWERERPLLIDVAHQSRLFFRTTLTRLAVVRHTASLIAAYVDRFGSGLGMGEADGFGVDGYAHFAGLGTIWSDPGDWIQAPGDQPVEGFVLEPGLPFEAADLRYCPVDPAGTRGEERQGFEFCGTRGLSRPLHGLCLTFAPASRGRAAFRYAARFADGTETPMVPSGTPLFSASPLIGFRLYAK